MGSLCGKHECSRTGCAREAAGLSRRRSGSRGRDRGGGLCDRHYKKSKGGGSGAGFGGCPPVGTFGPMGMGMPMGFPPFFGEQAWDSSDSDSDLDDRRRPRRLPFGGVFL